MSYTYTQEATWLLAVFTAPHILTQASHILGSLCSQWTTLHIGISHSISQTLYALVNTEQATSHSGQFTFFTQYSNGNHGA